MLRLVAILSVLMLFASCEEKTTWDLELEDTAMVFDGIISSELKSQELRLYKSLANDPYNPIPISNAIIQVGDGTHVYNFVESDSILGLYVSTPFAASVENVYWLTLEVGAFRDTAVAKMVAIAPMSNDVIIAENNLYRLIYGGSSTPAMTEYTYDWSHSNEYCAFYGNCYAKQSHYTLNNIDLMEEYGPNKEEVYFPKGTRIYKRKYSLSPGHEQFCRSLLIETQWRGGLFDMEQGNVPSNFTQGTRGWFGVCMVINDTITVN